MSAPADSAAPAPGPDDLSGLDAAALLQRVRAELVRAQVTVLELNDALLAKETERADLVSLLAQLELALEAKITHLVEVDRELNRRLAEAERRAEAERAEKVARDAIIQDLVVRLDAANREIGAAHELAGRHAREAAESRAALARTEAERAATAARLDATAARLAETDATLAGTAARLAAAEGELARMRATLSWRLTRPFRDLRDRLS